MRDWKTWDGKKCMVGKRGTGKCGKAMFGKQNGVFYMQYLFYCSINCSLLVSR